MPVPPRDAEYDAEDDVRLMLAVKRGETEAFALLYERHLPGVVRTLEILTGGDRAAAEDLAQEAFLRVYNARQRYEPSAKFTTWLYRIVTNLARNWQRDRGVRRTQPASFALAGDSDDGHLGGTMPEPVDPSAETAEQRLAAAEIAQVVAAAIAKLPANQREAMILARYRQMSYQEVGEALDLGAEAVKSLLARARANLKDALSPFWQRLQRELGLDEAETADHAGQGTETAQDRNET